MKVEVIDLADRLKFETAFQKLPIDLSVEDYIFIINNSIKQLYIETERYESYPGVLDQYNLEIDEQEYVILCAKIKFFELVQTDVNNIVSYTTDAISVASADKPYVHIGETINKLNNDKRILYYKLIRFIY